MKICGGIQGTEYNRYTVTTLDMEEFIRRKVATVLEDQSIANTHEVYCYPQVMGDTRGGIKYASMCICMSGITENEDTLYDKIKQFSYKPIIFRGIQNAIVKSYEFSEAKLRSLLEHPKLLRMTSLSPKDISFLYDNRILRVYEVQGKPFYMFYADMDRILDDFLMDAESDDPVIPNYTVIGIKALGKEPNSPLSYDVVLTEDQTVEMDKAALVYKSIVVR